MKMRTCSDCRYEKEAISSEVCATCHGLVKGEPSNWKRKTCLICNHFGKGIDEKPCSKCFYDKYRPSFELKQFELDKKENKEMKEIKTCNNCRHSELNIACEPCRSCTDNESGERRNWNAPVDEIKTCSNCKHASDGLDDDICEQCSVSDRGGTICYWENRNKTESKQEVYNGVTPSCWTCKYFEDNSDDAPCSKCVAICNGTTSYWEERDNTKEPQTAREVVEKTTEQRLQEEHFDEHYHDKVQPLEIMQEIMTPEEFRGFLLGNIIKYSCRCGKKDEPQKEFAKLRRYREWYDKAVLCEHIDPRV